MNLNEFIVHLYDQKQMSSKLIGPSQCIEKETISKTKGSDLDGGSLPPPSHPLVSNHDQPLESAEDRDKQNYIQITEDPVLTLEKKDDSYVKPMINMSISTKDKNNQNVDLASFHYQQRVFNDSIVTIKHHDGGESLVNKSNKSSEKHLKTQLSDTTLQKLNNESNIEIRRDT